jgi:hypothetical protein
MVKNEILTNLPTKNGIGMHKNKEIIDWKKLINKNIEILYNEKIYVFYIEKYEKQRLEIEYNNKKYNILTGNLLKFKIGSIVGSFVHKYDINYAKNIFKNHDYILLEKTYIDSKRKMKGVTKDGYYIFICIDKLKQGRTPCLFGNGNPFTIENIKLWLKNNNKTFELISNKFVGQKEKLQFYCNIHKKHFYMTLDNVLQEKGCERCGYESYSGENHYNYNPNLTNEERELGRNYIGANSYDYWRTSVFKRDDYTCQCCGKTKCKINAHHLDGWNWCIENRVDINNGITLCEVCHKEFHLIYGKGDNTKEQYIEFIENKL